VNAAPPSIDLIGGGCHASGVPENRG